MSKPDKFTVEVLADGSLKIETDKVSAANHINAEKFLSELFRVMGGDAEIKHKHGKQIHAHTLKAGDKMPQHQH